MICISTKKACIISLILSLIFAIIGAYACAYFLVDGKIDTEKVNIFLLARIIMPVLFVIIGSGYLGFIAIINKK